MNHDRQAELRCRGTISVEQSSCCSMETRDDSAHFQETTEGISVPHLMCWRTEGTFTTARRCCGVFVILAPLQNCRLTYLLTYLQNMGATVAAMMPLVYAAVQNTGETVVPIIPLVYTTVQNMGETQFPSSHSYT